MTGSRLRAGAQQQRACAHLSIEPELPSVAALSKNDTHQLTDMEVADQWRREWAGTAEYGKVRSNNPYTVCLSFANLKCFNFRRKFVNNS